MRKWIGWLVLIGVLGLSSPQPAAAGSSTDAALGLGAFAVLNQFLRGETIFQGFGHRERVVVQPPPAVIYAPPEWDQGPIPAHGYQNQDDRVGHVQAKIDSMRIPGPSPA